MYTEAEIIKRMAGATDELGQDLIDAFELSRSRNGDPFSQRVLIRTVFSYFEGEVAGLRNVIVEVVEAYYRAVLRGHDEMTMAMEKELNVSLTDKEYCLAANKSYQEFCEGIENPRDSRLGLEQALKSIFRLHGQVFRHEFAPEFRGEGWNLFLDLKQKRNRITHPATWEDYAVTEEDGRMAEVLGLWVGQFFDAAHKAATDRLRATARRMGIRPEEL